jgi:HEAT repeat protein
MNLSAAVPVVLGSLLFTTAALGVLIVVGRVLRQAGERRLARIAGPTRPVLLAIASGDDAPEHLQTLIGLPPRTWRAVEPSVVRMLGKLRGEAYTALVTVLEKRGAASQAARDLRRRDPVVRGRAAEVLGRLGRHDSVPGLCRLLADRDPDVRVVAARALGRIGDPGSATVLLASAAGRRVVPPLQVAQAVARFGSTAHQPAAAALQHPAEAVRAAAVEALGLLGAVSVAAEIAETSRHDRSQEVRVRAVRTLGKLGTPSSLQPLLAALEADNPEPLRAEAACALGTLGAVAAVAALAGVLGDGDHRVAHNAAQSLLRLGPQGHMVLQAAAGLGAAPRHVVEDDSGAVAAAHAHEALAVAAVEVARRHGTLTQASGRGLVGADR